MKKELAFRMVLGTGASRASFARRVTRRHVKFESLKTNRCKQVSMDPNFPLNLDIHPSSQPSHLEYDRNYSFEAQEIAIRKYGIAGRVW